MLKLGAVYVMRAAQSKGKVDLLALWELPKMLPSDHPWAEPCTAIWLVQCKTGSARMSPADKNDLKTLADQTGSVPVLAEPGPNGRGVVFIDLTTDKEITLG